MDRAAFLEAARAAAPKLRKVTIDGLGEVFIRQATVDEAVVLASEAAAEANEGVSTPIRVVAAMVRDETGALLFDPASKDDMAELQAALGPMDALVIQLLLRETNRINEPEAGEVDEAGN